jgi:GTP-binding protein
MSRRVVAAEFVISAAGPRDFPADGLPEIALVGRSNVGKSTLINALIRKDLARTSAAPGKTRLVNVYRIAPAGGGPFYLVDLPGYGHAGGGDPARREFAALTGAYFESRTVAGPPGRRAAAALAGVVLTVDARHPGMASDVDARRWIHGTGLPFLLVATKVDKLSQSDKVRLKAASLEAFGAPPLSVSALDGIGLDELWRRLLEWTKETGSGLANAQDAR